MKKIVAITLASVMLMMLLFACAPQEVATPPDAPPAEAQDTPPPAAPEAPADAPPSEPIELTGTRALLPTGSFSPDNPQTISLWTMSSHLPPAPDNRLSAILRDVLGVTITYDITPREVELERIATMLAGGGDLPDILGSTVDGAPMAHGGAYARLDDYIFPADGSNPFPNIRYFVEPYLGRLSLRGSETVPDGLYQFPNYNRLFGDPPLLGMSHGGQAFYIQKAVLEWHGFPDVHNLSIEQWFTWIEEYLEAHPQIDGMDTIGFTFPTSGTFAFNLSNPPNFLFGHANNGRVWVEVDTGVATVYATTQEAQDWFRFLNAAFNRGIVYPGTFTQSHDEYLALIASGRVLGVNDQGWIHGTAQDALASAGLFQRQFVPTAPVWNPAVHTPWFADRDIMNVNQGFGISATAQQNGRVEMLLEFLDILLTPEWQILLNWGEEGIDFHVDENGFFYRTPEQREQQADITWQQSNKLMAFYDQAPKIMGTLPCGNAAQPHNQPREILDGMSEFDRAFLESYGKSTWREFLNVPPENPPWYPGWQFAPIPGSPAEIAFVQMEAIENEMLPGIIMASPDQFDALWAAYVERFSMIDTEAFEVAITEFFQQRIRDAS